MAKDWGPGGIYVLPEILHRQVCDIVIVEADGRKSMLSSPLILRKNLFSKGDLVRFLIYGEYSADGNRNNELRFAINGADLYCDFSNIVKTSAAIEAFKMELLVQVRDVTGVNDELVDFYLGGITLVSDSAGPSGSFTGRSVIGGDIGDQSAPMVVDLDYIFESGKSGNLNIKGIMVIKE